MDWIPACAGMTQLKFQNLFELRSCPKPQKKPKPNKPDSRLRGNGLDSRLRGNDAIKVSEFI
ncbi:hypothetical protein EZZ76_04880 [Neisseria meningitidis]|nr:hypothetical protein [Neisseria meningitidis]